MNGNGYADVDDDVEAITTPLLSRHHHNGNGNLNMNTSSQVALVGANVCPIESLDYEILENEFLNQDWRSHDAADVFQYIFMKWLTCFLVGISVGLIGFFNNLAGVKFQLAFVVFFSYNLALTAFSTTITSLVALAPAYRR